MNLFSGASGLVSYSLTKLIFLVFVCTGQASLSTDHIYLLSCIFLGILAYHQYVLHRFRTFQSHGLAVDVEVLRFPNLVAVAAYTLIVFSGIQSQQITVGFMSLLVVIIMADLEDTATSYVSEFVPHLIFGSTLLYLYEREGIAILVTLIAFIATIQMLRNAQFIPVQIKEIPESDVFAMLCFMAIFLASIETSLAGLSFMAFGIVLHFCIARSNLLRLFSILSPTIALLV